jgi:hypothetical protein
MFSLSRRFLRSSGLLLLAAGLVQPAASFAQAPGCCAPPPATCGAPTCCPPAPCCAPCPPPDICTCTTFKPVCDTCYRTQQCVGYHNVCKTCYRQEPYCVTVPVTKVDCVTVDEGCYKMVWCPRPVVKIPRTEYHQQMCSRCVPYTVSQCVPHVTTQVIPETRVRYVPCTHTYLKPACPTCAPCPCCPAPAPGCGAPFPLSQQMPAGGYPSQGIVSANPNMPQQPFANGEPDVAPAPQYSPQYNTAPAQQYAPAAPMANMPQTEIASANNVTANSYANAQAAASAWQASRGYGHP